MAKTNRSSATVAAAPIISTVDGQEASGTIRLAPLQTSLAQGTIVVEVGLTDPDSALRFGDLRVAAIELDRQKEFEAAHRLWSILGTEAFRLGDLVFATGADERADAALSMATIAAKSYGRTAQYDYEALATDRLEGLSVADTAKRWSCSPTTVKRALKYVEVRNDLLRANPQLFSDLDRGDDVSDLAQRYGVETKIMRWIVVSHFDRRSKEREE